MLGKYEVPVAYSMVELLRQSVRQTYEPFQEFMFNWIAFNNIYTTLADQAGHRPRLKRAKDGTLQTRQAGSVTMPKVEGPTEREQLDIAFHRFSEELKHDLIMHENTRFFVYRSPKWDGQTIEFDEQGQRLNGVLNVGYTISSQYPFWSPIDINPYERYVQGDHDTGVKDTLSKQILDLLYVVRNNTFHGGKRVNDSNDREVLQKATLLLSLVVVHFLSEVN